VNEELIPTSQFTFYLPPIFDINMPSDSTASNANAFGEILFQRIKDFGLRCIPVCDKLFSSSFSPSCTNMAKQLARSSSSSVANYRAVRRARSHREFYSKLCIVIEELDESLFWIEYAIDAKFIHFERAESLLSEGNEILKILVTSRKTSTRLLKEK
jgi:four helix bundle protein